MRLTRLWLCCSLLLAAAPAGRAEYIVLRSGQRLTVNGYQLLGDKYRLQLAGGTVVIAAEDVLGIEPEEVFTPLKPTDDLKAPFRELIEAASAQYKVDADLITSVIAVESNFEPKAISRRNARGLMQLLPETATRLGVKDVFDPGQNIDAGTRYLSDLLQRYHNNLVLALAAYNAGPEKISKFGNVPPYRETISYVRRVKQAYENSKSGVTPRTTQRSKPVSPATGLRSGH
ncbi:MAG: lytic transglycosylase domain-containing protein [Candidatus Acidiferrales bacterium]